MQQQLNEITVKFFRYIDTKFSRVDKRFTDHDAQINSLYQLIDTYVRQAESNEQEALLEEARVTRLEQWVASRASYDANRVEQS